MAEGGELEWGVQHFWSLSQWELLGWFGKLLAILIGKRGRHKGGIGWGIRARLLLSVAFDDPRRHEARLIDA
jgi:hypothetical protein